MEDLLKPCMLANLCMIFVINSCTKFEDQLIKGTDVVEPQSCRKSRNFRLLAILSIFKKFGRGQHVCKI